MVRERNVSHSRAGDRDRRRDADDHAEDRALFLLLALRVKAIGAVVGIARLGLAAGIARPARVCDAAALVRGLLLELLEDLVYGVGLVRAAVAHGAAAVGLVFIDDEVAVAVLKDAEGLCPRIVQTDEKAHLRQRQLVPLAEGRQLVDGSRRLHATPGGRLRLGLRGRAALGDGRAAVLTVKAARRELRSAMFTVVCHITSSLREEISAASIFLRAGKSNREAREKARLRSDTARRWPGSGSPSARRCSPRSDRACR